MDSTKFRTREYGHQVTVELKATFLKIIDIDTLSQQFEADFFLQAKWEEAAFAGVGERGLETLNQDDVWDPCLIVVNLAGDFDFERRSFIMRYEEGYEAPVVLQRWRFKGIFREPLELQHFPFDVQDLTLQVSSERSVEQIRMKHDQTQLSSVNVSSFHDYDEWSLYQHVECHNTLTTVEYGSSTVHPILVFSVRVRRRTTYFFWNIIFIVFLVLCLSFLTIAVDSTTTDRLGMTITLFLTMVAFKLVVKQSLPTISYLTYLDYYVLGSLLYLVLFAMENAFMIYLKRFLHEELIEDYDDFLCLLLISVLVIFHLILIIYIQVTALRRHRQMMETDRQYAVQARNLAQMYKQRRHSRPGHMQAAPPMPTPPKPPPPLSAPPPPPMTAPPNSAPHMTAPQTGAAGPPRGWRI